jgi:hypothetical protein
MSWLQKLQQRWNTQSTWQVIAILLTFILTGTTVMYLKKPILLFLFGSEIPVWAKIVYYILILPIYNVILLFYGFLLGQFNFFWEFEKKSIRKLKNWKIGKSKD